MLKTRFESRGRSVGNKKKQTISIFCKEINKDLTTTTKFVPLSVATKQRRIKRENESSKSPHLSHKINLFDNNKITPQHPNKTPM